MKKLLAIILFSLPALSLFGMEESHNRQNPFYKALYDLDINALQKILDKASDENKSIGTIDFPIISRPLNAACAAARKRIEDSNKAKEALKIITLLREHGAQVWKLTNYFDSPFHCVAGANSLELIYSLLVPLKTKNQKRVCFKRNQDLLHIRMPQLKFTKELLEKRLLESLACWIKDLATRDAQTVLKDIQACMSEQEIATIELTLDTKNKFRKRPMDLATDKNVKMLLNPQSWQSEKL